MMSCFYMTGVLVQTLGFFVTWLITIVGFIMTYKYYNILYKRYSIFNPTVGFEVFYNNFIVHYYRFIISS